MAADDTSPLTPAVLHVLLALGEGPLHGYGVMKRVEDDSGLGFGPGTIYGALDRLSEAGWVEEVATDSSDARRGRSYALTDSGREALRIEARRMTRVARLVESRAGTPESSPAT